MLRCSSLFRDVFAWTRVARILMHSPVWQRWFDGTSPVNLEPYTFQVDIRPPGSGGPSSQRMTFSASISFPGEALSEKGNEFRILWLRESRIMWTIVQSRDGAWKSVDHFSMLEGSAITNDGAEFFTQFISELEETRLKLCRSADEHLSDCVSTFRLLSV